MYHPTLNMIGMVAVPLEKKGGALETPTFVTIFFFVLKKIDDLTA